MEYLETVPKKVDWQLIKKFTFSTQILPTYEWVILKIFNNTNFGFWILFKSYNKRGYVDEICEHVCVFLRFRTTQNDPGEENKMVVTVSNFLGKQGKKGTRKHTRALSNVYL